MLNRTEPTRKEIARATKSQFQSQVLSLHASPRIRIEFSLILSTIQIGELEILPYSFKKHRKHSNLSLDSIILGEMSLDTNYWCSSMV